MWPVINSILSLVEITAFTVESKSCAGLFWKMNLRFDHLHQKHWIVESRWQRQNQESQTNRKCYPHFMLLCSQCLWFSTWPRCSGLYLSLLLLRFLISTLYNRIQHGSKIDISYEISRLIDGTAIRHILSFLFIVAWIERLDTFIIKVRCFWEGRSGKRNIFLIFCMKLRY